MMELSAQIDELHGADSSWLREVLDCRRVKRTCGRSAIGIAQPCAVRIFALHGMLGNEETYLAARRRWPLAGADCHRP
jgi:hypothetical protein